jgi:hypothetical protein
MSTHLPLRVSRPVSLQRHRYKTPIRQFSSSKPQQARKTGVIPGRSAARIATKNSGALAPGSMQQEALESGDGLNDDVGVLPGQSYRMASSGPFGLLCASPLSYELHRLGQYLGLTIRHQKPSFACHHETFLA